MSEQLRKHQSFLRRLAEAESTKDRRQIVKAANSDQLKSVASVAYNTLKGRVRLNRKQRDHVLRHSGVLKKFVNNCCSTTHHQPKKIQIKPAGVRQIRKHLSEQRGGFIFPALIPLLGLIGKAALGGVVGAGTGLAVKKAFDR